MNPIRIAYISTTRADFGVAKWILKDLECEPGVELLVVASGSHMDKDLGSSINEVRAENFTSLTQVPLRKLVDTPESLSEWLAQSLVSFVKVLERLCPDFLLLVGDRIEALTIAQAATILSIPIAHVHGGEITEGAMDDGIRHAITKLSQYHYVAAPTYARRVQQLGVEPGRIRLVGSPGLCTIARDILPTHGQVMNRLQLPNNAKFAMVTYHPVTTKPIETVTEVRAIADVVRRESQVHFIITGTNVDPGYSAISAVWQELAIDLCERVRLEPNLGHSMYLASLRDAQYSLGNSSSGLIEAPALGTPTVNVGSRQTGRLKAPSVHDCRGDADEIIEVLDKISDTAPFASAHLDWWFKPSGASSKIAQDLCAVGGSPIEPAPFHDCGEGCDSWNQRSWEPHE